MKKIVPWILVLFPAFVFVQSLPFKFTGAPETEHIFGTIGAWFGSLGIGFAESLFAGPGPYLFGAIEAIAAILLLIPKTRQWGAMLGLALLTGAIFFHVFTPLGIAVEFPGTGQGDPTLFIMAVIAWGCCLATLLLGKRTQTQQP